MIRIKMHQIEYQGNKIKLDSEIEASNQDRNNNYMFPTGKIDSFEMYPMDFNEYLYNRNRTLYNYLSDSFNNDNKVLDAKKNKGSLDSLYKYRETNKNELAIKVSQNKYGYNDDNKLLTLPFYYLGFYLDDIKLCCTHNNK